MNVRKFGTVLRIATDDDGTPLCPDDGVPMVSDDGGRTWECPIGKAEIAEMAAALTAAFDRIIVSIPEIKRRP